MKKGRRKRVMAAMADKKARRGYRYVFAVIAVFLLGYVLSDLVKKHVLYTDVFVIEEIRVKGNAMASTEEILGDAEIVYETPFFKLDNKIIEERVLRNNRIKRAIVTKQFPNVVEIFVEEKKTIALITIDETYEVARDGSLMQLKVRDCDLPMITGFSKNKRITKSENVVYERELDNLSMLLNELYTVDANFILEFSEFSVNDDDEFVGVLRNGITTINFGRDELYTKGLQLYSLLKSNKNELKNYNEIDLRFKNLAYAR